MSGWMITFTLVNDKRQKDGCNSNEMIIAVIAAIIVSFFYQLAACSNMIGWLVGRNDSDDAKSLLLLLLLLRVKKQEREREGNRNRNRNDIVGMVMCVCTKGKKPVRSSMDYCHYEA